MYRPAHEHLKAPGQIQLHTTRLFADAGLRMLGGLTTSGDENIRNINGPYVQTANHSSLLDVPALGVAAHRVDRQHLHYITKDEMDIFGIGWWLGQSGSIFIKRRTGLTPQHHSVISARAQKNAAFATWPEGHRYRGPLKKENIMSLVIIPLVFEHTLTVVPVGIAGTEAGDIGFMHVAYGDPIPSDNVDFEPDPGWDTRKRTGMLSRAIKAQLGKDRIDEYMEDLFQGMSKAGREAVERRRERMSKRGISRTILLPLNVATGKTVKEKPFKLK